MSIASETGVSEDVSSKNLQLLEQGGFLKQKREGKYLFYSLNRPDRVLQIIANEFHTGNTGSDGIIHLLTALTHERRILIVAALANGHQEFDRLCLRTGISRLAMERQIDKLVRRSFVSSHGGQCRLLKPENRMADNLVRMAIESVTLAQV